MRASRAGSLPIVAFFAGCRGGRDRALGRHREIDPALDDRPRDMVSRGRPGHRRHAAACRGGRQIVAHQPDVAKVQRGRRPFRSRKYHLPTADRSGAEPFTFSQFVDADLHLVLAGVQRKGEIDAGLVARRALVLDREDQRHFLLRGIEGVELQADERLPVRDPGLAIAEAIALGKDDLQRLAAQFLAIHDGHGRCAVAARVVGDLALADIEQGFLRARRPGWRRRPSPAGIRQPPGRCFERSSFSPPFAC